MAKAKKAAAKSEDKPKAFIRDYSVLVAPIITEKSSLVAGDRSKVVFRVQPDACKIQIREAVERVYGVKVTAVNTVNYMGKAKRTTNSSGRRASWKKAYVTLAEGQSLELVEGL